MAPKKAPVVEYDGPREGEGKFFYPNGATYTGSWKMLMPREDAPPPADGTPLKPTRVRHGTGVYQDGNNVYKGDFSEDAMDGEGTFTYASGASYSGSWRANKYHGRGTYIWPDGRSYEGDFEDNVMHGNGSYKDTEDRVWSGKFFQGSGPGLTYDLP